VSCALACCSQVAAPKTTKPKPPGNTLT